jgi:hypothetical protein
MNYKRLLNITLVIILSSYAYSSEEVSIVGVVIDSKGKPVKKADVELLTAKKEKVADTKTAKDGTFKLKDLKAQNYYLNITSKKKGSASVVIRAWPSGNIDIKDLKVTLSEKGGKQKSSFGPKPSLSDNNVGPPTLQKGGALADRQTKKPPKKVESETVSVAGVVIDSKGQPVKKAEIELLTSKKEKVADTKSDKKGTFDLNDLKAQNYYLNITSKKKGSATVIIRSWPSGNIDIKDLKVTLSEKGGKQKSSFGPEPTLSDDKIGATPDLQKGGALAGRQTKKPPKKVEKVSLSGKVLNKKGKPEKKAKILLFDENYNPVEELETNKEGLFSIEKLKPANYSLTISRKKKLVKFKLKSWPKNNQSIKNIDVTLTKEKQKEKTLTFGPEPPQANAGPDQEFAYEKNVTIDGSKSYNPNSIIQSYEWKEISKKLKVQDPTKPIFDFQSPRTDQTFEFELTVRGPGKIIDKDTVKIIVYNKNIFPIADAGKEQTVDLNEPIILDGSKSNDPDGEIKSYHWKQISGEKVKSRNWKQSVITLKTTSTLEDTLAFELMVEDKYNSDLDTVVVYVVDIPEPLILLTSSSSASEGIGTAKISLGVSAKSGKIASVHAKTYDSTATGNSRDYTTIDKIISVPAGKTRITFPLNINNDNIDEYDETLIIKIIDTTVTNANTGATRTHMLTIIDDDLPPSVEFLSSNTTVSESVGRHYLILTLSNQSGKDISVNYQVQSTSSAMLDQDYTIGSGTSYFPAGKTRDTLDILIINDPIDEPRQTIVLALNQPVNASIGLKSMHTVKINDDDPPPYIYIDNEKGSGLESDSSQFIAYSLSSYSEKEVTVNYRVSTYGTTSRKNKDYVLENGTMIIPAGPPGKSGISFTVIDDKIDEYDELLIINLVNEPENATMGTLTRYTFTIIDNDDRPTLEFSGDDHGNEFLAATKIKVGSTSAGIIELGGDIDVFRFDLKYPITVLTKSSGNTDVFAEILDNAGQLLASDDNSRDTNNFMMKLPLLPGPHFLRVKHYSQDGTGDYVLTLESSEMYDKQADDLILNKTQQYFHPGHIIYNAQTDKDKSYYVDRIQIDSVSYTLDSKRFITIIVNDSIVINPSHCYVPSNGRYENLGIIQKNYISNPLDIGGLPQYLPEEYLDNSLVFGVVRDYRTRRPIFGAEIRVYAAATPSRVASQTNLINLADGETWDGGNRLPTKRALYNVPKINSYPEEKGRRITGLNGKFAIAVQDTGFLLIRANAPTNNYRVQEKKIKIRNKRGDFYGTDIWLIPK